MIYKASDCFEVTCDWCEETEDFYGSESDMFAEMVTSGWQIQRENKATVHICPECVEEWKEGGMGALGVREKLPVIS